MLERPGQFRRSVTPRAPKRRTDRGLCEQLPVERDSRGFGAKPEAFIEQLGEPLVAGHDSITQTERRFRLEREAPAWLVQLVDRDAALGGLERAARVAGFESRRAGSCKQIDLRAAELSEVAVGPGVVGAVERLAAPERERLIECCRGVVGVELAAELVGVDPDAVASEPVAAVGLAEEGVAEDASGFGGRLPQAGAAALGVRVGPERFEQLVAGGAVGVEREVGDQLTGRRASRRRSAFDLGALVQVKERRRGVWRATRSRCSSRRRRTARRPRPTERPHGRGCS